MGTPDGFLKYDRRDAQAFPIRERINNYNEYNSQKKQESQLFVADDKNTLFDVNKIECGTSLF